MISIYQPLVKPVCVAVVIVVGLLFSVASISKQALHHQSKTQADTKTVQHKIDSIQLSQKLQRDLDRILPGSAQFNSNYVGKLFDKAQRART